MQRRNPFPHQLRAANYIAEHHRCGLWMEPRTGKTLSAIYGVRLAGARTLLVVAPPSIHGQWYRECALEGYRLRIHGDRKTKAEPHGLIVSYESLWRPNVVGELSDYDAVIFDESIKMQSYQTKLAKWLHAHIYDLPDIRVLLSGAPCPESPLQAMHQLYIAKGADFMATSWWHYLRENWRYDDRKYKWFPIGEARKTAKWYIESCGFAMTQAELGFQVRKVYDELRVEASKAEMEVFEQVLTAGKYIDKDGNKCELTDMTRALFLQAVSAGVNPLFGDARVIGDSKIVALVRWIKEKRDVESEAQFVVFAKHTGVQRRLMDALAANDIKAFNMNGSTPSLERDRQVQAFHKGDFVVAVVQCRVGEVGLDLSCANYLLYLENSWSGNTRIQSEERCTNINKMGAVEVIDVCLYFGDKSVDAQIAEAVKSKKDANDKLLIAAVRNQNAN